MLAAACKDGSFVSVSGNMIVASGDGTYIWTGFSLSGPRGMVSMSCRSIQEAFGIVVGLHGGSNF